VAVKQVLNGTISERGVLAPMNPKINGKPILLKSNLPRIVRVLTRLFRSIDEGVEGEVRVSHLALPSFTHIHILILS
jgi:hypothetical protein